MTRPIHVSAGALAFAVLATFGIRPASAQLIGTNKDVNTLRTSLGANEGYLDFYTTAAGEEYTGYTDQTRHDWADNWITVRPIRLKDSANAVAGNSAEANIDNDFEYLRKIYAQAGMSVRRLTTVEQNLPVTWNNFTTEERVKAANAQNNTNGVMNLFYADKFRNADNTGDIAATGLTFGPSVVGSMFGATTLNQPYSYVSKTRVNNTAAHELGHQLLNGDALWMQGNPASESTDTSNLMYFSAAQSANSLQQVGQLLSAQTGGHDILEHRKDGANQEQISRIHENGGPRNGIPGFTQHANYHLTHGDRADFDWVADQRLIETINGGGNGADHHAGTDFLIWKINPGGIQASNHQGPGTDNHDHGALGALDLPGFAGDFFNRIDVVSDNNLYADNDIGADGNPNMRAEALDYYIPDFSVDGTNWVQGTLEAVFQKGWNDNTTIDDWVARFTTDIQAQYVRITAAGVGIGGHDGNAQIDAIIASVPEPASALLALGSIIAPSVLIRRRRVA